MVVVMMLAIGCKESGKDHERIERMLSSQVLQLDDDVAELEGKIKMVEGLGSSDEDKERRCVSTSLRQVSREITDSPPRSAAVG